MYKQVPSANSDVEIHIGMLYHVYGIASPIYHSTAEITLDQYMYKLQNSLLQEWMVTQKLTTHAFARVYTTYKRLLKSNVKQRRRRKQFIENLLDHLWRGLTLTLTS